MAHCPDIAETQGQALSNETSHLHSLSKVQRADGLEYFCFSEVKAKLFPHIPVGTIKTWIRHFNIIKPKCTFEEHAYFKGQKPDIAVGAFKLISKADLVKLMSYCKNRESGYSSSPLTKKRKPLPTTRSETATLSNLSKASSANSGGDFTSRELVNDSFLAKQELYNSITEGKSLDIKQNVSQESEPSTLQTSSNEEIPIPYFVEFSDDESSWSGGEDSGDSDSPDEQGNNLPANSKRKRRFSRKLDLSELDELATREIERLKLFFTRPLNSSRSGPALQEATVERIVEHALVYLKFVKDVKGGRVSLASVEDENLVEQFCNFLRSDNRGLKSSTTARYIHSLITVGRFLYCYKSSVSQNKLPFMSRLRALYRQLEFDARREGRVSEGSSKHVLYEEILQVARVLMQEFEQCSTGTINKARNLMNFCILLLYAHATGRCKEFVSLRIIDSESSAKSLEGNFLINQEGSPLILLCKEYKTKKFYGPDKTTLQGAQVEYYIRLYIETYRTKLLQGNIHDYFLVNMHGSPFSVSSFNSYLGKLFQKHCNVRLGMNDLRHSLVTYFLNLPEGNDSKLAESLATVMRHTVRSQRAFYDKRTREAKKAPALGFLARKANDIIFDGETCDNELENPSYDEEGYLDELPIPGDFVALVAQNSSKTSPEILVAKVLRYSGNKSDVLLAHLEEESERFFKLVPGKSYMEATKSLIFPIDLVYRPNSSLYELRSDKSELHAEACPRE